MIELLKFIYIILVYLVISFNSSIFSQSYLDTLVLRDNKRDEFFLADSKPIIVQSSTSLIQGFIYRISRSEKHPILILLNVLPVNDKNLDLAGRPFILKS